MVFMQKFRPSGMDIQEGMTVSVRKITAGQNELIPLGEGKIRKVTKEQISIYLPFLEDKLVDTDIIKVFWENGRYYFCGTASSFYPYHMQFDLLTLNRLEKVFCIEKRKHFRLSKSLAIDYKWIAPPRSVSESRSNRIRSGIGENLCCGGLEFLTSERLGVGDLLELGFEIPSFTSYMVFTKARIVRICQSKDNDLPYRIAVQFINMDPQDRRLIAEFILEEISNQDISQDISEEKDIC